MTSCCFPTLTSAQKSKLTGSVIDAESGERLIGVTVRIANTHLGAKTNVNGIFTLQVDPGEYTIDISYLGYEHKRLEATKLSPGEIKRVEVSLKQKALDNGKDVVVTGKISTETQTAQLIERKKAAAMNDVIGAEQIRRAPDATSADAIRRMPGVTITGNKFVNIRGTNERYNNALLNGTALTSTEPDKKAFSFDLLPSNLLDNTIVSKTFTPDLPGNFSGGLVQLNTINFPDHFLARLSITGSDAVSTSGKAFVSSAGGGSDWLATDDGTRALPSIVPSFSLLDTSINDLRRQEIGRAFSNSWAPVKKSSPVLNQSFALSIGDAFQLFDNEVGYILSASYKNGYDHTGITRAKYNLDNTLSYTRDGLKDTRSVGFGGLFNISYRLSETDLVSLKNVYDRSADDETLQLEGVDSTGGGNLQRYTSFHYTQRSLLSNQLSGDHLLSVLGGTKLNWRLSRAVSTRSEPDLRRYVYEKSPDMEQWYMLIGQSTNAAYGGRFFSDMTEANVEGGLDMTIPLATSSTFKLGGVLDSKTRDFNARVFAMRQASSDFNLIFLPIDSIFSPEHIGPKGFQIDETTNPSDKYDASEHVASAYAMVDAPFSVGGVAFRVIGGLRLEHSTQDLNSGILGGRSVAFERMHNDVLPALSLVYSVSEKINLRAAWSNTLSRPEFREIAPFAFYDFELGTLVQGDTNIDRVLIRNLDFRFEYYPTAGELLSVSLFHKRFGLSNELFGLLYPNYEGGAIEQTNEGSNNILSWANAAKPAVNYGFEVEIRKNLSFLGEYFANFLVSGNYSNIVSKVDVLELSHGLVKERPMQGQAPYTLNVGLLYLEPTYGGSVNLLYNTYGKRIEAVDYVEGDLYEMPRDVIDLSLTQPIGNVELKYTARDILAQDQIFQNGEHIERINRRSPVHSLSISMKF